MRDSALPDGASACSLDQALNILQRDGRQTDLLCIVWLSAFKHSLRDIIGSL